MFGRVEHPSLYMNVVSAFFGEGGRKSCNLPQKTRHWHDLPNGVARTTIQKKTWICLRWCFTGFTRVNHHETTIWDNMFTFFFQASNKQPPKKKWWNAPWTNQTCFSKPQCPTSHSTLARPWIDKNIPESPPQVMHLFVWINWESVPGTSEIVLKRLLRFGKSISWCFWNCSLFQIICFIMYYTDV